MSSSTGGPLRWLLMASHVPPGASLGGIVRYTVELARSLGAREDVELHLTATRSAAPSLAGLVRLPEHLHVVPRAGPLGPLFERYGPLPADPRAGGRRGFDVVQGAKHLLPPRAATAGAVRVLAVHDMILLDRPQDFPLAKRTLLRRPYRQSLRSADVLLCISAATRERLRAWEPAAAQRAAVTPLASSPRLLADPAEPVPALAGHVAAGRPFALVVGDPSPRKNVPLVVTAWARVSRERPDAVLALVGPPSWGASAYGPHADDLEAAGRLVRLGSLPDRQLRWAYERAAAVLCPSLLEGFGLPVVEAIDLGAPVVVSSDPALVEASAGRAAAVLAVDDAGAWADALVGMLTTGASGRTTTRTPRTWADVAEESVAAVRGRSSAPG